MHVLPRFDHPGVMTFVDVLRRRAELEPDARAFTFLDEDPVGSITVGELDAGARAIAALIQRHARPGDRALLLYPPGREYVLGFLGCLYAGVIAVPAYPPDPARLGRTLPRLQALVADCGARVALTTSMIAGMVDFLTEGADDLRSLKWVATDEVPAGAEWTPPTLAGDSLAFLQYTSGSTGTPKGVMLSHRNLLHNSELIAEGFAPGPDASAVIWLPPYHDMGLIGGILQPLFSAIPTAVMSPLSFLQRPLRWLEAISEHGATISGGPNFAFDLCVRKSTPEERARLDLSRWEVAFCGAEPLRADTFDRFAEAFAVSGFRREAFYPCYGLAEGTLIVTGGPRRAAPIRATFSSSELERGVARADEGGATFVGSGAAIGDQQVCIVEPDTRKRCAGDRIGEIWVSGRSVAEGYWQRPEETAETFRARLASGDERAWLRTGDLGFLREGELFVTGRRKDLIIIRGRNHYPQDLERTVEAVDPGLRPGCGAAFAVESGGEERLVLVQEISGRTADDDAEAVLTRIRSAVAEAHLLEPHAIVLIRAGSIPKTSSGKIQRRACRQAFLDGALEVVASWSAETRATKAGSSIDVGLEPPASKRVDALVPWLTRLLAGALGVEAVGLDPATPLVRFGLDSLRAIELQGRIEQACGVTLPGAVLLGGVGVDGLARMIAETPERPPVDVQPVGVSTPLALSEGQKALWFLERLTPGTAAYNVSRAVRIRSELDPHALARAFAALVARHPALRTQFVEREGSPSAALLPVEAIALEELDASGWSDTELQARLEEDANRPFELARGPLVRARLYRSSRDAVLLLCLHHSVTDFWSLAVMAEELGALYTAERSGSRASLPPLPVTPFDAAASEAVGLTGPRLEALAKYWKAALAGAHADLPLPSDRPRRARTSAEGATLHLQLEASVRERLARLARETNATPYAVLLASYFALLHHLTGEEDLTVGSPTAGRTRPELRPLVGYFVNPVALRSRMVAGRSFRELVAQTRGTVLGALAHAELPLSRVVEQVRPERLAAHAPLFQTMFVYQRSPLEDTAWAGFAVDAPGARATLGGLELETVPLSQRATPFDLTLVVSELDQAIAATFEYRSEAFDAATVHRFASTWETLVVRALEDPDRPLEELVRPDAELRERLFEAGRAPAERSRSTNLGDALEPLHRRIEAHARRAPEAVALVAGNERITYAELDARAKKLAERLRASGIGPESRVGVALGRIPEAVIAFLAILEAHATYVPLELKHPDARLELIAKDARLALVLTQERHAGRIRALGCPTAVLDAEEWPASGGASTGLNASGSVHPDLAAYVIYTSGSTGKPKGVVIPHRGLSNLTEALSRGYQVTPESRVLQFASAAFDAAVAEVATTLGAGATLHLMPEGEGFASLDLPGLLRDQRITGVTLPPSVLAMLEPDSLPELRTVISAGEACSQELVSRWSHGRTFINAYGPTEISVCATFGVCVDDDRTPAIGRAVDNASVYVLDSKLQPVGIGVPGELYVGGAGVARGYLDRPALTAERFLPDPFSGTPGARLYRTGDRARWRGDLSLEFLGRTDDQVKIRGHRVELGEVEAALRSLPGIADAVAVARRSGSGETRLIGYLVPGNGPIPMARELKTQLRARLPEPSIPAAFVSVSELPLTPNGKVDRRALPAPEPSGRPEVDPRTPLQDKVARAWAKALDREQVGLHEHFFDDLGGSSLTVVRACAVLRDELGEDVPVTHLFEHPTVEALAARLSQLPSPTPPTTQLHDRAEARRQALARRTRGNRR